MSLVSTFSNSHISISLNIIYYVSNIIFLKQNFPTVLGSAATLCLGVDLSVHHCLLLLPHSPTVVEGNLFSPFNVPLCKHGKLRHVDVEVVDVHAECVEVWITAVVNEVGEISKESGVDRVDVLLHGIEVQVKEIGPAFCVVLLSPLLSLVAGDDFPDVVHHEGASLDVLHGLHSPAAAVVGPEDGQLVLPSLLHQPVGAALVTGTFLVALEQRRPDLI